MVCANRSKDMKASELTVEWVNHTSPMAKRINVTFAHAERQIECQIERWSTVIWGCF